ncbi:MAG: hypothetical protein R6X20_11880 [Phycisphaerae bacterium]
MALKRPKPARVAALLAVLASACLAGPARVRAAQDEAGPDETDTQTDTPGVTARFVRSEWHSLFLDGEKVGYTTTSLYRLSDGGHRLKCNTFLRRRRGDPRLGFFRKTTADVDARFRPLAVTCEVGSGTRHWRTAGRRDGGVLRLRRTIDGETGTAAVPVEDGMTFRCWAVPATVMSGTKTGATRRWLAVDASLGALLPDPIHVRALGPHTLPAASDEAGELHGRIYLSACGVERVAHLVGDDGRVLRRLWQSSPMVAEAAALSEARRLDLDEEPPPALALPGLSHRGYRNERMGLSLYVPPAPYALHVVEEAGAIRITDLTDEAQVDLRPVLGPPPPAAAPASGDGEAPPRLAAHPVQKEWAARFEDVTVAPSRAAVPGGAEGAEVLGIRGTARLGCTTFHYRNLLYWGAGLTWFVTIRTADRPVQGKPMLSENVVRSLRIQPPRGRLPLQTIGTTVRSPLYGFQVRLPSRQWTVPEHTGGLPTALEAARQDQAAVAVVRMMGRDRDRTLETFVRRQAGEAARRLGVAKPEPQPAMLGGLPGYELVYEGDGLLSGRRAECTAVYVRRQGRVMALVLMVRADAGDAVRDEVTALRESVQFLH